MLKPYTFTPDIFTGPFCRTIQALGYYGFLPKTKLSSAQNKNQYQGDNVRNYHAKLSAVLETFRIANERLRNVTLPIGAGGNAHGGHQDLYFVHYLRHAGRRHVVRALWSTYAPNSTSLLCVYRRVMIVWTFPTLFVAISLHLRCGKFPKATTRCCAKNVHSIS